ncbi:MAG: AAA family ATPase [Bacteroidetes bacterium]|nr:AAA family ATPase [Bacteroidota bacterium]
MGSIFKKATNQTAFLKTGLLGFQGSGKTYTAVEIAIGLHKMCKAKKPIMFLDTETGSDWAIPLLKKEKIDFFVSKTRAFSDLLMGIKEAEENGFLLIIDSVSHYWNEMVEAYKKKHRLGARMAFHHWGVIKPEWRRFSDAYVNSQLHCIVCGRAGWDWGHEEDDEGNKELTKLGTKMKVEGEFGFEPSFLLEMERIKGKKVGDSVIHRCHVIKDRRMDGEGMDGKTIDNPSFKDFLPHVNCLNLGGEHVGVDVSRNSEAMFAIQGESYTAKKKRSQILIEEIDGELESRYPGTGKNEKIIKRALKKELFGTYSDTQIEGEKIETLNGGLGMIRDIFNNEKWVELVDDIVKKHSPNKELKIV